MDVNNVQRFSYRKKAVQRGRGGVSGGPKAVRRSPETKTERVQQRTAGDTSFQEAVWVLSRRANHLCPLRQTLALLNSFKTKLTSAIADAPEEDVEDEEEDTDKGW